MNFSLRKTFSIPVDRLCVKHRIPNEINKKPKTKTVQHKSLGDETRALKRIKIFSCYHVII